MATERLQKILAHAGIASRRASESLIEAGRVRVNGRIVRDLGVKADPRRDRVDVDGKRVVLEKPVHYLLHKPREVVTTLDDPEGRTSIRDLLRRVPERVYPVGRLDYHTSGVLLITNDGELADALTHPRRKVPKIYVAKIKGTLDEQGLEALGKGVALDDGKRTAPADVRVLREEGGHSWVELTIREGKYRQVHRMFEAVGRRVMRLVRTHFAGLTVEGLRPGQMRPLTTKELDKLKRDYLTPARRAKQAAQEAEAEDVEAPQVAGPLGTGRNTGPRNSRARKTGTRAGAGVAGKRNARPAKPSRKSGGKTSRASSKNR